MENQESYSYTKLEHPKMRGSAQLFSNPLLERLTHTHIAVPLTIFGLVSTGLIYYGITYKGFSAFTMLLLFVVGWFIFTLVEYLLHRFLYHIPANSAWKQKIAYTMHGNHHDYPKDKSRLAMPPILALALATILYFFFLLFLGNDVYGFLAGFLIGYAVYLGIHYAIHTIKAPNRFFKAVWDNHSIHHYREDDRAFGVSTTLWDHVFGTLPRKGEELKAYRNAQRKQRKAEKEAE